jgi:hypothetical protein
MTMSSALRVHSINPPSPCRNEQLPDASGVTEENPQDHPHDLDNPRYLLSFRFFYRTGADQL